MSEPRITDLRFKPRLGSRWAVLRVGMTLSEAQEALGPVVKRDLFWRVQRGQICFEPPIKIVKCENRRKVIRPQRGVKYVNGKASTERPCLCCRQPFESSGPGNRLCERCRGRDVSPYAI